MRKVLQHAFLAAMAAAILSAGAVSARQLTTVPKAFGACKGTCSATVHCSGTCSCWIPSGTTGFCVQDLPGAQNPEK
jgi:uncharacterized membrane protein